MAHLPTHNGVAAMLKTVTALLFSLLVALPCSFAQSTAPDVEGIWRDINSNSKYYSLHVEGDSVVLLDLSRLERTHDTLASAYMGKLGDLILTRVGPTVPTVPDFNGQVALHFTSASEGSIMGICEVCTVVPIEIRKIF
jgi:hypothetical protein